MSTQKPEWSVDQKALNRLLGRVEKVGDIPYKAGRGLYTTANIWLSEIQMSYVPVKTGNLRASGHVTEPKMTSRNVEVRIVFGGPSAAYAAAVHANHKTKSKYLESVVLKNEPTLAASVVKYMGML